MRTHIGRVLLREIRTCPGLSFALLLLFLFSIGIHPGAEPLYARSPLSGLDRQIAQTALHPSPDTPRAVTAPDTARSSKSAKNAGPPQMPKAYKRDDFHYDTVVFTEIDTQLFGVWRYEPVMQPIFRANLGVAGSASRSLWGGIGPFQVLNLGYRAAHSAWNPDEAGLFYGKGDAFTRIDYTAGAGAALQRFQLLHTQDLGPTTSLGVEYRQLGSDGFYVNQEHRSRYARLFGRLLDRSGRYALHVEYLSRRKTAEECGGLVDGRVFESRQSVAPLNLAVNLGGASSLWSERELRLRQEWRLGRGAVTSPNDTPVADTPKFAAEPPPGSAAGPNNVAPAAATPKAPGDPAGTGPRNALPPGNNPTAVHRRAAPWTLFHEWTLGRESFRYADNNPLQPYLPPYRYSDSASFDSSGLLRHHHSLGIRKLAHRFPGSACQLSAHYLDAQVLSDRLSRQPQSAFWLSAAGGWQPAAHTRVELQAQEVLHNRQQSRGRMVESQLVQRAGNWALSLRAGYQRRASDWVAGRYDGNYTRSDTPLAAMEERSAGIGVAKGSFRLDAGIRRIAGLVYFDSLGQARQHGPKLDIAQIAYRWTLVKGIFRWDVHHGWQFGQSGPLRAPVCMVHDVLSIEKRFRSGFSAALGVELRFQSRYKAPGYRPEVGQFVVQDTLDAGGYPLADAFLALKVRNARLYLRMDHLNSGWGAPGGFQVPLYPIYARALRFGIRWDFYR